MEFFAILAGVLTPWAAGSGFPEGEDVLTVGGRNRSAVIVGAGDTGLPAARELAKILKEITGCEIPVVAEPSKAPTGRFVIHVGPDDFVRSLRLDLDSLHPVGYRIRTVDRDHLIIAGRSRQGTLYGVFDFLKRYGGYRLFGPPPREGRELVEILPRRSTVVLPESIDLGERPSFMTYMFAAVGPFGRDNHVQVQATHNLSNIFPPEKYAEAHPEYFPMYDGRRSSWDPVRKKLVGPTMGWQPCVSHPDLPGIAVEYAREFFSRHPEALGLSLGVNDGGGDCECPRCLELKERYKNPYIPFVNEVARRFQKEFPGKFVGFITYAGAGPVPMGVRIEPNVYVEIMHGGFPRDFERIREWHRAGAKHTGMYAWLYGSFRSGYVLPRHYPRVIGNAWKRAHREFGLKGVWFDPGCDGIWPYEGPRNFVLNELHWNIDADIEALLRDYFTGMYARAAVPMRELFDRIEEVYSRRPDPLHPAADCHWTGGDPLDQFAGYTPGDLTYLEGKMKEANAAETDPLVVRRLELFGKIFGFSRLHVEASLALQELKKKTQIREDEEGRRIVETVARGLEALRGIEEYVLSEPDQKRIFGGGYDPKVFESSRKGGTARALRISIEREAERLFGQVTEHFRAREGGWPRAREFWRSVASGPGDTLLKGLARTQIFLQENPEAKRNLVVNPGCEPTERQRSAVGGLKKRFPWSEMNPEGWKHWSFGVADFYWDGTEAHSGDFSACVGKHRFEGAFVFSFPVEPGGRYRVRVWVKQQPPDRGGSMLIDLGGVGKNRIQVPYPKEKESRWRPVETVFTAVEGVTGGTLMLYAPVQKEGEFIWFDDVEIVKICDAAGPER